jgi:glycine/serine hydroxymethyltransferase
MGAQEMTRYGMGPAEFQHLGHLIAEILREGADKPPGHWRETVQALRADFTEMRYCFE